ncbi:hypothetical protein HUT19_40895 [Streptomyces sp. NA02950]|uniref:hypothetical protein n=1 Tax=Streptomyces sp. NA02950 TaxID=2742137 RepID=UPI00158FDD01|nr:hypothetical protein [Streptomyces sp. NA02950]QKV90423.1 hypothetical protein HUT19_00325 [Streptomyces sp. NA02950]QKV97244.1 hypothetical protein HUT19_40895 [Streptomyces sp. NA02950]
MSNRVQWGGQREHLAGDTTGEQMSADEATVLSQQDWGCNTEVTWHAEWHRHACGATGDGLLRDDTVTYSDHACRNDLEEAA